MLDNENPVTLKILFLNKITEIKCFINATIKEVIENFAKKFLSPDYELKYFSLTINGKSCILENRLITYINDISNNNIFILSYNYNMGEKENYNLADFEKNTFYLNKEKILEIKSFNDINNNNFNNINFNKNIDMNYKNDNFEHDKWLLNYSNKYQNILNGNQMMNPMMNNQMMNNQMRNNQMMMNPMMNNQMMNNQMMMNPMMNNQIMNNQMKNNQMMNNQMMNNQMMMNPMMNNQIMNNQMMMNPMINNPMMNNQMMMNPMINNPMMNNNLIRNNPMMMSPKKIDNDELKEIIPRLDNYSLYLNQMMDSMIENPIDKNNIIPRDKKVLVPKDNFLEMEIDIKFFKSGKTNKFSNIQNLDLHGLLKLCLLKEIAICEEFEQIEGLPEHISYIITILKNGKIKYKEIKSGIKKILEKIKGANILNFSKYVDNLISKKDINKFIIPLLKKSKYNIFYIQNCLEQYIEFSERFEKEFDRAKKESAFEYSIIASGIIERDDISNFEDGRKKCPNRVDRILFHGTCYEAISSILPDIFRISTYSAQHGEGVYFTEDLESCWIYGSEEKSKKNEDRRNCNIPKVGQYFSFIASAIYYDNTKKRRVYDCSINPKKNEINYAFAEMKNLDTIMTPEPDKSSLFSTEFVVNDLKQICPFMCFKLKRDEYCIIWRDNNFSKNPVYNNEFDSIFKEYLKERIEYINKLSKFNIYPCETSEEALKLIKRKKYNKIILISNIGSDLGGKKFVEKARKIINNDVLVFFSAYNIDHLEWIKNFKNALFSNEPKFYDKFLECFNKKYKEECKNSIKQLKNDLEKEYDVKFNFNEKFLDYPYAEDQTLTELSDLTF